MTAENVFKRYQYTPENILECEYYLLEEFDCYLIVYHPYRPLTQYCFPPPSPLNKTELKQQQGT